MGIGVVFPICYTQQADSLSVGVRYETPWAQLERMKELHDSYGRLPIESAIQEARLKGAGDEIPGLLVFFVREVEAAYRICLESRQFTPPTEEGGKVLVAG